MAEKRDTGSPDVYRFTFLVFRDKDPVLYERLKQAPNGSKAETVLALVRKALAPPRRRGDPKDKDDHEHQAALAALNEQTERLRLATERMERLIASLPAGSGIHSLSSPPSAVTPTEQPSPAAGPAQSGDVSPSPTTPAQPVPDGEPLSPDVLQRMREMAGAFDF